TTMLDARVWDTPFIETYTSEKLPWASTPAEHSYPTFPPADAYEALISEFARRRSAAPEIR
ncbi:MAG: Glutathione-dependent formaldehyde-activating, partial [Phenylobacterium sp.]|nr:Glutathione-dependent formaldehyde-activating [Phenylobacterium sp.]